MAYTKAADCRRAVGRNELGERLSFFFNAHNPLLSRKWRSSAAARRLWAAHHE